MSSRVSEFVGKSLSHAPAIISEMTEFMGVTIFEL
jgi:hypothetical protein